VRANGADRRPNGAGSVYMRGEDGLWAAEVRIRQGRRRVRRRFYGKTRAQAEGKLADYLATLPPDCRPLTDDRLVERLTVAAAQLRGELPTPRAPVELIPQLRCHDAEWLEKLARTLEAALRLDGPVVWDRPMAVGVVDELREIVRRNRGSGVTWL